MKKQAAEQAPGTQKIKKPRKGKTPKVTETPPPEQEPQILESPALQEVPQTTQEAPPIQETSPQTPEASSTIQESLTQESAIEEPESQFTAPITLESLQHQIDSLNVILQELLARKRKPPISSGKVQIRDKVTGTIFKSKNNAYQTLLKSGALKELVDRGVFGPNPEKNTFGIYALLREWPDRFEEVKADAHE